MGHHGNSFISFPPVGGWIELDRTTLGSAGDEIDVTGLSDKRYYMILRHFLPTGGNVNGQWQFNADTGSNYANRQSSDGDADSTATNGTQIGSTIAGHDVQGFTVGYIANFATKEKLLVDHGISVLTAGAGTAPNRREAVAKHAQTSNPITSIKSLNSTTGDYNTNSEMVVLEWDPADVHTTNFWEELASVEAGSNTTTLSTGTFTAKKYLWIQAYWKANAVSRPHLRLGNTTLDAGSNYAERHADNGGADVTGINQTECEIGTGGGSSGTRYFFNYFIINVAANEKLISGHSIFSNTAGAANAPSRTENANKWTDTTNQCDILALHDPVTANAIGTGSLIKVWGSN